MTQQIADDPATDEAPSVSWEQLRRACNRAATEQGVWAGAPLPVEGERLHLEKRYPFRLDTFDDDPEADALEAMEMVASGFEVINHFHVLSRNLTVSIFREHGKIKMHKWPLDEGRVHGHLRTLNASLAYNFDAEATASEKLYELVGDHKWKLYQTTGCFAETSKRSGVLYFFRRQRPTIALAPERDGHRKFLCALCLHPIGWYGDTFAGCMVPTDDVIAHLLLMRGDEHRFWKHSEHHAAWDWRSGL
jgi:hypothetical protein